MCRHYSFFIHPPNQGYLHCFCVLTIWDNTAYTREVLISILVGETLRKRASRVNAWLWLHLNEVSESTIHIEAKDRMVDANVEGRGRRLQVHMMNKY